MKNKERIDSFSSDDELPLSSKTSNGAGEHNSYQSLRQTSVESCEFCDKVFKNRYNSLVHNASHIIIPLINQNVVECEECHFYFTSQKEHDLHVLKKHTLKNGISSAQPEQSTIKMRHRLRFEDEDCVNYSSDIINNLTRECEVKLSYMKQLDCMDSIVISDDDSDSKNKYVFPLNTDQGKLYDSSFHGVCNNVQTNGVISNGVLDHYDSVHCDVLKMPKCVSCGHCERKFPDRYKLIIHEASHMDADRSLPHLCTICDWYISGTHSDLKRHVKTHAHKTKPTYKLLKHCSHCGLKYRSLVRHANNYHSNWIEEEKYEKIIHVCDLCYEFLKSRTDRYYTKQGVLSEVGRRHTCNQCTRMFFELNIVRTKLVLHNWGIAKKIKKKLTNKQRLDKIQNRLLKMNRLRKL